MTSCGPELFPGNYSDAIEDLLPEDPFGMNVRSDFMTLTSWLEADFNLMWNAMARFQSEKGKFMGDGSDVLLNDKKSFDGGIAYVVNVEEFRTDSNSPHDAMFFALRYLGLKDLLTVERVCRSLRDAVKSDTLLWRSIEVHRPLSDRFTDDALFQLASRAQGTLKYLMLMGCVKITDFGLRRVFECNPGIVKLSVPGCMRLTVEHILFNLRVLKSAGILRMKRLRIGGLALSGLTDKKFEELRFLLGADNRAQQLGADKPRYYCYREKLYLNCDDDRAIDVDICPRCHCLNLIYDCPGEGCQVNHQTSEQCRACVLCIKRCYHCGRCIQGYNYEETFTFDPLCMGCSWAKELRGHF